MNNQDLGVARKGRADGKNASVARIKSINAESSFIPAVPLYVVPSPISSGQKSPRVYPGTLTLGPLSGNSFKRVEIDGGITHESAIRMAEIFGRYATGPKAYTPPLA
jgi:hypothetical protein